MRWYKRVKKVKPDLSKMVGEKRTVTKFLFFPKCLFDNLCCLYEWRWLEVVKYDQIVCCRDKYDDFSGMYTSYFIWEDCKYWVNH